MGPGSETGSRASQRSSIALSAVSAAAPAATASADPAEDVRSAISLGGGGGSLLAARRPRSQLSAADGQSALSWRTPSSIRSSEPSEIARNKIAELQLRVELERVVRLQREMELEKKRKEGLIKEGSSLLGGGK